MDVYRMTDMVKGWIVGNFEPSVWKSENFEVAIKYYKSGDKEPKHFHRISRELTAVADGKIMMNGTIFNKGDVIVVHENEVCEFEALDDSITVVVKTPSVSGDKFIV